MGVVFDGRRALQLDGVAGSDADIPVDDDDRQIQLRLAVGVRGGLAQAAHGLPTDCTEAECRIRLAVGVFVDPDQLVKAVEIVAIGHRRAQRSGVACHAHVRIMQQYAVLSRS
jgi:hypothetical protein